MSTLKQLRLRITGVKSTQKITKTMKMVSASKLIKAQEQKDLAKPYANKMYNVIVDLAESCSVDESVSALLAGNGKDKSHLIVAVSSDRGLCGGFNSSIAKSLKSRIQILKEQSKDFKIICIGKKVFDQIKSIYPDSVVEVIQGFSNKKIKYSDAQELAKKIIFLFNNEKFDVCTFIYSEFQNALKQLVTMRQLIPLNKDLQLVKKTNHHIRRNMYEYEPDEATILKQILPLNLAVQIYYILLETVASEHGARMTAMDAATNNASDMIAKLTLQYNRSRQASITRELIEIISSAEVV